jgi:hypothetical protein
MRKYSLISLFIVFILSNIFFSSPIAAADLPQAVTPELYTVLLQQMYAEKLLQGTDPATLSVDQIQAVASAVAQAATIPQIGNITGSQGQYVVSTGLTGIARGVVPVGRYRISVQPLDNFTILLATDEITIDKNAAMYLGIGIQEKKGKGTIHIVQSSKNAAPSSPNPFWTLVSRIQAWLFKTKPTTLSPVVTPVTVLDTNTIILQLFADANGNGVPDSGEKSVEWANLQVTLTKVSKEQIVELKQGNATVTFDQTPSNMKTVTDLAGSAYVATGGDVTIQFQQDGGVQTMAIKNGTPYGIDTTIIPGVQYQIQSNHDGSVLVIY